MSITVANLMAQVGADLTQFRLGMNEVDARLNQVKVRSAAGMASVAAMRAESVRMTSAAGKISTNRMVADAARAAGNAGLPLMKQQTAAARAELTKAETALAAFNGKRTATNAKSMDAAQAEVNKRKKLAQEAQADYNKAEKQVDKLTLAVERLGKAEDTLRRRAAGLATGANTNEQLNSASAAVARAYAQRLSQNSNEHRIRALNTISGTAETIGLAGAAGLTEATIVGADFNQMMIQTAHNTSLTSDGIKVMQDTVRELGSSSGGDLREIAQGFRLMTDYGNNATQSQMMMRVAMKASVATGSDLITTSELLAKATKEFNLPVSEAATTMGIMIEAGRRSTLTQEQMVQVGGQLYATAANLGVSFVDANAALITYTKHGLSASQASVQLRNDIAKIIAPTKGVRDILKDVSKRTGVDLVSDFSTAGLRARTMLGIWQDITKAANKLHAPPVDLAVKIFPNQRGTIGASIATGMGYQDFAKDRAALANTVGRSDGLLNKMYADSVGQLNVQIERLKNISILTAGSISNTLTPSVVNLLNKVNGGVQSFNSMGEQARTAWIKLAVGASVGLIVFGVVGKLIVGISALNTALLTMSNVGLATVIMRFGPWGLAIAAAIYGIGLLVTKYNELDGVHVSTAQEMSKTNQAQYDTATASRIHAGVINNLVNEYDNLRAITNPTHAQLDKMRDILNRISVMSPDLVSGYDNQGNAIALMGNAAEKTAQQMRDMAEAQRQASVKSIDIQAQNIAQLSDTQKSDLQRLKYSVSTGKFPNKIDDKGSYDWYQVSGNKDKNNPYLSRDDNPLDALFGGSNYKMPNMHKGTPVEIAEANASIRRLEAQMTSYEAQRKRLVTQGTTIADTGGIVPQAGPIGALIAAEAEALHKEGATKAYAGYCERLQKITVDHVTTMHGLLNGNADEVQDRLMKHGVGQAYTGGPLAPGTLAWTEHWNPGGPKLQHGHAMTIGPDGYVLDNVGSGHSKLSKRNIEWILNPDTQTKGRDPWGASQRPGTPGPDILAGLGQKDKKSKEETEWERRVKAANGYMEELRKKQYELIHTGALAANEWEIQSGKLEGMGKHYADVSRQIVRHTMALELDKKMSESARNIRLTGHDDIKAGMELVGGYDVWKDLDAKQKAAAVSSASHAKVFQSVYDMSQSWQKRAAEAIHPVKSASDEANASIQEVMDKLHVSMKDPMWATLVAQIKKSAKDIDTDTVDKYSKAQKRGIYDQVQALKSTNAGDKGKIQALINTWLADNKDQLELMTRTRPNGQADTNHFIKDHETSIAQTYELGKQVEAQTNIDRLVESTLAKTNELRQANPFLRWVETLKIFNKDKGMFELPELEGGKAATLDALHTMFDNNRNNEAMQKFDDTLSEITQQAVELQTINPFEQWLQSYETFDRTLNNGKGGFLVPSTMDMNAARDAYNLQAQNTFAGKMKETLTSLNQEAISLRERDPFKVWEQSYQIFDASLNKGRGGYITPGANDTERGANEKQLKELYDYQTKLDLMKRASEGLTGVIVDAVNNGYGKGFKGMFENIKEGFRKMLFDMAVQFLQSRLLQLVQSKLFGATGGVTGGSGANSASMVSIGSTILGGLSSFFGGNAGQAATSAMSIGAGAFSAGTSALSGASSMFANRAIGGPISAGQSYIMGDGKGPELVTPRSAGWVYTAEQTKNMMAGGGGTTNYNISINTPDAGSFHRSSGAVLDEMHRAAMRAHVRNR